MANMIPKTFSDDTKSSAERKLFKLFRDMPDTECWTVLHSVGIAKHVTQAEGETDFLVVILRTSSGNICNCIR